MIGEVLAATASWDLFLYAAVGLGIFMLLWDTVEVGRNDAANLVNAVFGARILNRRTAVLIAGVGVVLGATFSEAVIETARKGIFDPPMLTLEQALSVYIAVYIVDTVLLYSYSAFGMPVSTTACLVFELLGASFALGGMEIVHWDKAGMVVTAIVLSIIISGIAGFLIQRMVRGAIRDRAQQLSILLQHGAWAGGGMLAALFYFMIVKGMKHIELIQQFNEQFVHYYGAFAVFMMVWGVCAIIIHAFLVIFQERAASLLFPTLAILGMISMGFAFGQNDLANCASPGLAIWNLAQYQDVAKATHVDINRWLLFGCGLLLVLGMTTKNAQRVTKAEVNTGSMSQTVALWAPRWCIRLARFLMKLRGKAQVQVLAPPPTRSPQGKRMHYDSLRACVILGVSASVIATASSLGLPVSTTYVAFAAVVATGAADRILQRGDADLKLARTIWVIFSWFAAAIIAAVAAGIVCRTIFHLGVIGMVIGVGTNVLVRWNLKNRADKQEERTRQEARERKYPERYAEYEG